MPSNTTRIAKNTLMLYFRQILIMLVSLYTVRVVLETLGAEDYGIYNVVAGVVTMFGFLGASMSMATQRYLSFEIGRNDAKQLKNIFSLSFEIYVLIALVVLLLAETLGLWFFSAKLTIPLDRKTAALWVYHFSMLSFGVSLLTNPYMAAVIAHEDMRIYAYVSIIEAALKLGIVFLLQAILLDKLQLYGILTFAVTFINTAVYRMICKKKYPECILRYYWNTGLFKEIASYTGWNLFISIAGTLKDQGNTILLNQFFNSVVVSARSIAVSVMDKASSFSNNFGISLYPQIIKNYAVGQKEDMFRLVFQGVKGTYILMYIVSLPLALEMPLVLSLWLKNVPEYTILFTRLTLIEILIASVNYPIVAIVRATGKTKLHALVVGIAIFINFPVSFMFLSGGMPPYSIMIVSICLTSVIFFARLLVVRHLASFPVRRFVVKVMFPLLLVSILSAIIPGTIVFVFRQNFLRLCAVTVVSIISVCGFMYLIGLNKTERQVVKNNIKAKLGR
jgi:O-antigen/teichoic acid export membrane protein